MDVQLICILDNQWVGGVLYEIFGAYLYKKVFIIWNSNLTEHPFNITSSRPKADPRF